MRAILVFIVFIFLPAIGSLLLAIEHRQYGGAGTMMIFALIGAYVSGFSNGFHYGYEDHRP